jgi:hypothetical protein
MDPFRERHVQSPMTRADPARAHVRLIARCKSLAAIRSSPIPRRWLLGTVPKRRLSIGGGGWSVPGAVADRGDGMVDANSWFRAKGNSRAKCLIYTALRRAGMQAGRGVQPHLRNYVANSGCPEI